MLTFANVIWNESQSWLFRMVTSFLHKQRPCKDPFHFAGFFLCPFCRRGKSVGADRHWAAILNPIQEVCASESEDEILTTCTNVSGTKKNRREGNTLESFQ